MSELVNKVKEQKRKKMKLRRTRDLISQEILSHEDLASVKKSIKKVKKNKNHVFLPQIDDLFDSGIKTNLSKENNQSISSTSTSEIDFKKPVVDKKVRALKSSTKVNCVGQSWLVESYTDMSSCAESAKENSFETVSLKKSFTKKKKNTGSVPKKKPNITVLENIQLKPCFVLLDKMKLDVDDEDFKFLPSNSSSPFLGRNVSNLNVLQRQSSLTKEMFQELPNWSRSDYWDVEDLIEKRKAVDGSKSVSNIRNRPSLNGTIDLSTSKKSLKCNSTVEIENSLQSQSLNGTTKPTVLEKQENIDVVDKSKLEDGFKLNQSSMNGTINLSASRKSLKNNSTFEIDEPLNISRRQPQRRNSSRSTEQQKIYEDGDVNKTTAENGSKSLSTVNNSTYELNRSSINGTINLSTLRKSLKNNSTFEIDKPLDFSRRQLERSNSIRGQFSEKHTPEIEDVVNKTTTENGSKLIINGNDSKAKLTTSEKRRRLSQFSWTVNNSNCLKTIDNDLETDENNCPEPPSSPCLGRNLLTDSEKRGKLKQNRSTFTANNNGEVFQLNKPERKKWVILNENEKSLSRKSLSDSLANIFKSPVPIKRRTIGESSAKLERRRSSIFNKVNKKSPAKLPASFLNQESGFISQTLDETSSSPDGESNVFIFGRKSSEAPKSPEEESSFLSEPNQPEVITRRRSTLTLDDTVTDIDVLKSACDLNGSPKELEPHNRTTKKSRCVTFKDNSVIVIDDSETSFQRGSPIIINDSENDSFTVTSTTTPSEPRCRISSDSSLFKKSIGLNQKIRLASDDLTTKNKNLASASKSKLRKMPNFAKIHQKMFDKMPDLKQYSEKKKERAKLLLSGKKIPKQPEVIVPVTKKQLFTSSASASTKSNFVSSTPNVNKKMMGYTRFGFQVAKQNVAAKEEKLAVANKRRPVDPLPRQRFKEELKGVRSNKRFELLMKMRQV